ncbi:beta-1,6-N-acetylglucosaminyltransferase [Streptococcus parasuis]|uniref:beta-1,6-N-acetylglucosaminyltransferase n=1 Tax=Streptococcus parasuis TaxID=1501662 RepID=UPI002351B9A0|nr:beta-1,6-N-acetylglucosaminyltransferase [Streptococcus parasuis]
MSRRSKYYHFLQNYRRRYAEKWKNIFFTFCERISLVLQIVFGVNRVRNLDWQIKYGSQWVSITDELVKVILENKDKITSVFSYTNCADELFIQTIAYNCGFKDYIFQPAEKQSANLRCIDWSRGKNGNPYTYRLKDIDMLITKIGGGGAEKTSIYLLGNFRKLLIRG